MIAPDIEKDGISKYTDFLMSELEKEIDIELLGIEKRQSLTDILRLAKKASKYDIIHVQYTPEFWGNIFGYFWGSYFPIFAKLTSAKIVLTAHEYDFEHQNKIIEKIQKMKMKKTFSSCDKIIVHNEKGKKFIENISPKSDVVIIPHGIPKVEAEDIDEEVDIEGKVALVFGFIRRDKDYETVIDAIEKLEDYKLLIAGEPRTQEDEEYLEELEQYIKDKDIEEKVINYGYVPEEEIPKIFNTADVSILPYESSDGSGVLALSIGYEVPVIMSDVEISREKGIEVYNSKEKLEEKIQEIEVREMETSVDNTWEAVAEKTSGLYRKILE